MIASVVICTYNRSKFLERLLESLSNQTMPSDLFETLVVDDSSSDDTTKVCKRFSSGILRLKYICTEKNSGLAKARNLGVAAVSSDFVLFTDDDCIPLQDWIEKTCYALEKHPIVAGAVDSTRSSYLRLSHDIAEFHGMMFNRKSQYIQCIAGANMAFRKDVLLHLNGFREELRLAQDMDLMIRAQIKGYRIFFEPGSRVTHHHDRKTISEIFGYSVRHAKATIALRNQYGEFLRTPFFLRSPYLTLLAAPFISLGVSIRIFLGTPGMLPFISTAPVVFGLKLAWCWGATRGLLDAKNSRSGFEGGHKR